MCTYAELEHAVRRYLDHPALLARHRERARAIGAAKRFDAAGWAALLRGGGKSLNGDEQDNTG